MWNILIVLIIAAIIWFFGGSALNNINPTKQSSLKVPGVSDNKPLGPHSTVESLTAPVQQQVDYARKMQQIEQQKEQQNVSNQ